MARIVNKSTFEIHESANTPDFDSAHYLIDPDLSAVEGIVHKRRWFLDGDTVREGTDEELAARPSHRDDAQRVERRQKIREFRHLLLSELDWIFLDDSTVPAPRKQEWRDYRTAWRNIDLSDPYNVVYPVPPYELSNQRRFNRLLIFLDRKLEND